MGIVKSGVIFRDIENVKNTGDKTYIRSGDKSVANIEFLKNSYCLLSGEKFIFREGTTIGYGCVI